MKFADRTVKDLLALPVPRTAIVAAKFTVATAWCLVLAAWTGALGVGLVTGLRLPGAGAGAVGSGLVRLLLTAIMTIALVAPFALLASVARGYLAPVGGIVLATFLGQIIAALGYGAYFPWAVPALYAGIAGVATRPGPVGYLLVALVGLAAVLGTGSWWRRADQTQ
jgi:ABC-2 type transport system permease protein